VFMLYSFLIRLALSLLLAYLAVRRLRAPLRGLIVRAMPLKMRMSENALAKQARISNIVGISVWLMLAVPLYLLSRPIARLFEGKEPMGVEQVEFRRLPYRQPAPEVPKPAKPEIPPAPSVPVPPLAEEASTAIPPSAPAYLPDRRAAPAPKPAPYTFDVSPPHYLQLGAFRELARAWEARHRYAVRLPAHVWVGHQAAGSVPYKVLIGPFESRAQAEAFRRHHRLQGFPRPLEDIRLYQD
jgi:cell division protein FtsN